MKDVDIRHVCLDVKAVRGSAHALDNFSAQEFAAAA
jgi:hypothetical protein